MKTIDLATIPRKRLLVRGTVAIIVSLVGIVPWNAAQLETSAARTRVRVTEPRSSSEHFSGPVQYDLLAKLLAEDRASPEARDWLGQLADPAAPYRVPTQNHPLLGQVAPDFTRVDVHSQSWHLQTALNHGPVVLVFYLGYSCSACVHDLVELNADLDRFHKLGAEVVAVSGDSGDAIRQSFAQFGAFCFPVLSDPGHSVARSYGVFRPARDGRPEQLLHGTFIIGRDRVVQWVDTGDAPFRNDLALLYEIAKSEHKLPRSAPAPSLSKPESKVP